MCTGHNHIRWSSIRLDTGWASSGACHGQKHQHQTKKRSGCNWHYKKYDPQQKNHPPSHFLTLQSSRRLAFPLPSTRNSLGWKSHCAPPCFAGSILIRWLLVPRPQVAEQELHSVLGDHLQSTGKYHETSLPPSAPCFPFRCTNCERGEHMTKLKMILTSLFRKKLWYILERTNLQKNEENDTLPHFLGQKLAQEHVNTTLFTHLTKQHNFL